MYVNTMAFYHYDSNQFPEGREFILTKEYHLQPISSNSEI